MEQTTILTKHARYERTDRLAAIIAEVGLGTCLYQEPYFSSSGEPAMQKITSTGVLLIYGVGEKENVLITGYMLTMKVAYTIFRKQGRMGVPSNIYRVIEKNQKRYKHLYEM